jgi:hypothetical protein
MGGTYLGTSLHDILNHMSPTKLNISAFLRPTYVSLTSCFYEELPISHARPPSPQAQSSSPTTVIQPQSKPSRKLHKIPTIRAPCRPCIRHLPSFTIPAPSHCHTRHVTFLPIHLACGVEAREVLRTRVGHHSMDTAYYPAPALCMF